MGDAWPKLSKLLLRSFPNNEPTGCTLPVLSQLARIFPNLQIMYLPLPSATHIPSPGDYIIHPNLTFLSVLPCPFSPVGVARMESFLAEVFPNLERIGEAIRGTDYIDPPWAIRNTGVWHEVEDLHRQRRLSLD